MMYGLPQADMYQSCSSLNLQVLTTLTCDRCLIPCKVEENKSGDADCRSDNV